MKTLVKIEFCTGLVALCFLAAFSSLADGGKTSDGRPVYWPLTINGYLYDQVELAFTDAELAKGLMDRDVLAENGGMLFVFETMGLRSFWMKRCRIDLDLIYMDAEGVVVATHRMKMEKPQQRNESQSPLTPNQNTHQHHGYQRIDTHQRIAHKSDYHDESRSQP